MSADYVNPRLCMHFGGNLACLNVGHLVVDVRDGRCWVVQAEPQTLITDETLCAIAEGRSHPDITLDMPESAGPQLIGAVLTIRAANRTVVYRIGDRYEWDRQHPRGPSLFALDCWPAEWPD